MSESSSPPLHNVSCVNATDQSPGVCGGLTPSGVTDGIDAVVYVVVVLAVYTSAMVILLVKYLKREMRDSYLSQYLGDYYLVDESREVDNKVKFLRGGQDFLRKQNGPGWMQCYNLCAHGTEKRNSQIGMKGETRAESVVPPIKSGVGFRMKENMSPTRGLSVELEPTRLSDGCTVWPTTASFSRESSNTPDVLNTCLGNDKDVVPPATNLSDRCVVPPILETPPTVLLNKPEISDGPVPLLTVLSEKSETPPISVTPTTSDLSARPAGSPPLVIPSAMEMICFKMDMNSQEKVSTAVKSQNRLIHDGKTVGMSYALAMTPDTQDREESRLLQDNVYCVDNSVSGEDLNDTSSEQYCLMDTDRQMGGADKLMNQWRERKDSGFYSRSESVYSVCSTELNSNAVH